MIAPPDGAQPSAPPTATQRPVALVVVLALALVMGLVTALSNLGPPIEDRFSPLRAASLVLNAGWAWGGIAIVAGWARGCGAGGWPRRLGRAVLAAVLACAVACLAYVGVEGAFDRGGGLVVAVGWSVVSVFAGVALGPIGSLARRRDGWGLLARLSVPVGALVECAWNPRGGQGDATAAAVRIAVGILAVAVALIIVRLWRRDR